MRDAFFLFGYLSEADIDWIEEVGQPQRVEAGIDLIHLEQPAFGLMILLDGEVQVTGRSGTEVVSLLPGEVFGEVSFILESLSIARVTSKAPCLVLLLPEEKITERLNQEVGFAARLYKSMAVVLADRLQNTMNTALPEKHTVFTAKTTFKGEVSLNMLGRSGLAGARFDRLRKKYIHPKNSPNQQ